MLTKHLKFITSLVLLSLLLTLGSGCGQLSSLQSAKVLEKKEAIIGGSITGYGVYDDNVGGGDLGTGVYPYGEVFSRWGMGSKIDMGVKLSTGGNLLLDGKYQFAGNQESTFAAAIGGGLEFQASNFSENFIFRTHIPIYLSFHPNEKSSIYATPRYIFQSVSNDDNTFFFGSSLGYSHRFSPKITGLLEGNFYHPQTQNTVNNGTNIFQFGIGCVYHFD